MGRFDKREKELEDQNFQFNTLFSSDWITIDEDPDEKDWYGLFFHDRNFAISITKEELFLLNDAIISAVKLIRNGV